MYFKYVKLFYLYFQVFFSKLNYSIIYIIDTSELHFVDKINIKNYVEHVF